MPMVLVNKEILSWHFASKTGRLTYDRRDRVQAGLSLACRDYEMGLCRYGFHSSLQIIDAFRYRHSNLLSLCASGGFISASHDKLVATIRRHLVTENIAHTLNQLCLRTGYKELEVLGSDSTAMAFKHALDLKAQWLVCADDGDAVEEAMLRELNQVIETNERSLYYASSYTPTSIYDALKIAYLCSTPNTTSQFILYTLLNSSLKAVSTDLLRRDMSERARRHQQRLTNYNSTLTSMIFALPAFAPYKDEFISQKGV